MNLLDIQDIKSIILPRIELIDDEALQETALTRVVSLLKAKISGPYYDHNLNKKVTAKSSPNMATWAALDALAKQDEDVFLKVVTGPQKIWEQKLLLLGFTVEISPPQQQGQKDQGRGQDNRGQNQDQRRDQNKKQDQNQNKQENK